MIRKDLVQMYLQKVESSLALAKLRLESLSDDPEVIAKHMEDAFKSIKTDAELGRQYCAYLGKSKNV